jgi:hypothetical protein
MEVGIDTQSEIDSEIEEIQLLNATLKFCRFG